MTGLVEYRRAHDDRQQAQKRGDRTTTVKGGESSAHIQGIKRVVLCATGSATQKDGRVSYTIRYGYSDCD